jgi:hypothetical protein
MTKQERRAIAEFLNRAGGRIEGHDPRGHRFPFPPIYGRMTIQRLQERLAAEPIEGDAAAPGVAADEACDPDEAIAEQALEEACRELSDERQAARRARRAVP